MAPRTILYTGKGGVGKTSVATLVVLKDGSIDARPVAGTRTWGIRRRARARTRVLASLLLRGVCVFLPAATELI